MNQNKINHLPNSVGKKIQFHHKIIFTLFVEKSITSPFSSSKTILVITIFLSLKNNDELEKNLLLLSLIF